MSPWLLPVSMMFPLGTAVIHVVKSFVPQIRVKCDRDHMTPTEMTFHDKTALEDGRATSGQSHIWVEPGCLDARNSDIGVSVSKKCVPFWVKSQSSWGWFVTALILLVLRHSAWPAVSTGLSFVSVAVARHHDAKQLGEKGFFGIQPQVTVHQHAFSIHSLGPRQSNGTAHMQGGPLQGFQRNVECFLGQSPA